MSDNVRRLFLAIPLHEIFLPEIKEIAGPLQARIPGVKWVAHEQVHLTLHFFGDTQMAEVERIALGLNGILSQFGPMRIRLNGLGCFPDPERPQVIWIGIDEETGALYELHKTIRKMVQLLGFAVENRSFKPHATLGRVKRLPSGFSLPEEFRKIKFSFPSVVKTVGHFALYQSQLLQSGPHYEVLKDFPFAASS